jgi:hypothetical protein
MSDRNFFLSATLKVGQIRYDKSDWNLYINSRERMKQGQGYTMYIYNVDIKMLGTIVIVIVW